MIGSFELLNLSCRLADFVQMSFDHSRASVFASINRTPQRDILSMVRRLLPHKYRFRSDFFKQPRIRPTSCLTSHVIIIGRHWDDIGLTTSQAQVGQTSPRSINLATSATIRCNRDDKVYQSYPRCSARKKLGSTLDTGIQKKRS
jgi:hypothetical protein